MQFGERLQGAEEAQFAPLERGLETDEEEAAEKTREPHRQEEAKQATQLLPSSATPPAGTTQWTCGVMRQRLAPGVQDGEHANSGGQSLGIGGNVMSASAAARISSA